MNKTIVIFIVFLTQYHVFSQNSIVKDIDYDGVNDSLYIDSIKSIIICKLSTNKFKTISSKPIEIMNSYYTCGITETKNGFEFGNSWMRGGYRNQFKYNSKTKKIQLIGMSRYEFGTASNDGSGESSVNLLTGKYIGNWNYYNFLGNNEEGELIKIPTIKSKMIFKIINLEDFGEEIYFDYLDKCAGLFEKYKKAEMKK